MGKTEEELVEEQVQRLEKLHTRQVLGELRQRVPYWYWGCRPDSYEGKEVERIRIIWLAAKKVLAGREHIPNKQEAKRNRQEAARVAKGQKKSKNK